jgi:hypothetical protein
MKAKILETTDRKYQGEELINFKLPLIGKFFVHKELKYKIDTIYWVNENTIKLISSNYILIIRIYR